MTLKEAYSVPKHTSAICVQSFDDSLNSAIHITYRISLRSSSLREPRYPLLRVLDRFDFAFVHVPHLCICTSVTNDTQQHTPTQYTPKDVLTQSCTNKRVWLLMRILHNSRRAQRHPLTHNKQVSPVTTIPVRIRGQTSTFRKGWYGFTIMILPQVHLRKPCYDFYFL